MFVEPEHGKTEPARAAGFAIRVGVQAQSSSSLVDAIRCTGEETSNMPTGSSLQSSYAASSPEYAGARAERELSAITLPTAIIVVAPEPSDKHELIQQHCKPCRSVVTTRVFTVPSREAAPVHLWSTPRRPSTGQARLRSSAVVVGNKRASSAHPPFRRIESAGGYNCRLRRQQQQRKSNASKTQTSCEVSGFIATPARSVTSAPTKRSSAKPRIHTGVPDGHQPVGPNPYPSPPRRRLHAAPSSSTSKRSRLTPRLDEGCCLTSPEAVQGEEDPNWREINVTQKQPPPRPARHPRVIMSACARGLAIRRAVDDCCQSLPAVPGFIHGAARFLQQWDRATRIQRHELLKALANQLLACSAESVATPQQRCSNPELGLENGTGSKCVGRDEGVTRVFSSLQERSTTPHESREPDGVELGTFSGNIVPNHGGCGDVSPSVSHSLSGGGAAVHSVRDHNGSQVTYQYPAQVTAVAAPQAFLTLLGPHAGLLATRVSSHLRSLHACDHALGPCLRVIRLLVESTPAVGSADYGSNSGDDDDPCLLGQQLCTQGVIDAALEAVAHPGGVVEDPFSATEGGATMRRRHPNKAKGVIGPSPSLEMATACRTEALRLLLALTRAGGQKVREYLLRHSLPSSPFRATKSLPGNAARGGGSDALGRIVMAIRRPGCGADMRAEGGRLLVELGLRDHHVTNDGRGKVWNAVLCLLGGVEDGDSADGQILGCRVALSLLTGRLSARFDRRGNARHGNDCDGGVLLEGLASKQQQQQQRKLIQLELMLVPSVLNLSLDRSREVRKAAGELALLMTTTFPRPCCYLVVAGLVGLFGLISGVERGAPVAWIRLKRPSSRYREPERSQNDDFESSSAPRRDNIIGSPTSGKACDGSERKRRLGGTGGAHGTSGDSGALIEYAACSQARGSCRLKPEQDSESSADGDSTGGKLSEESAAPERGHQNRLPAAGHRSVTADDDKATFALELLQLICTGKGGPQDPETCAALAYALAPLAILDLVLGPGKSTANTCPTRGISRKPQEVGASAEGEAGSVFVTQAGHAGVTRREAASACSDHGGREMIEDACHRREQRMEGEGAVRHGEFSRRQATRVPLPTPQDKLNRGFGGDLGLSPRHQSRSSAHPSGAIHHAIADALLAMYRRDGGVRPNVAGEMDSRKAGASRIDDGWGDGPAVWLPPNAVDDGNTAKAQEDKRRGSSETLDLKRMIDALVDGCPTLSFSLRNSDVATIALVLSSGGGCSGGECGRFNGSEAAEIDTLRGNVLAMTKRFGAVRPPPPSATPASVSAADENGIVEPCDSWCDTGYDKKSHAARTGELNAAIFSKIEPLSKAGESLFLGVQGVEGDECGPDAERRTRRPFVGDVSPCWAGRVADGMVCRNVLMRSFHYSPP